MKKLLVDLEGAILRGMQDLGEGGYDPLTYDGMTTHPDRVRVITRFSTDPSQSNNGGNYFFYRRYRLTLGGVEAHDDWSCDFASLQDERREFYPVLLRSLEPMARLAFRRATEVGEAIARKGGEATRRPAESAQANLELEKGRLARDGGQWRPGKIVRIK